MRPDDNEERIALFVDYENLAIGARQDLGIARFDFGPIARACLLYTSDAADE